MKTKDILVWGMAMLLALPMMAEREKHTINDGWKFHKGDAGQEVVAVGYDDSKWERINIPHTWNTEAYVVKNYYKGISWYRKMFTVSPEWKERQVFLHLEGASKEAKVFVNGKEVGDISVERSMIPQRKWYLQTMNRLYTCLSDFMAI